MVYLIKLYVSYGVSFLVLMGIIKTKRHIILIEKSNKYVQKRSCALMLLIT